MTREQLDKIKTQLRQFRTGKVSGALTLPGTGWDAVEILIGGIDDAERQPLNEASIKLVAAVNKRSQALRQEKTWEDCREFATAMVTKMTARFAKVGRF